MSQLSFNQCVALISSVGQSESILLEGTPGIAKTSLVAEVAKRLNMHFVSLDAACMDMSETSVIRFESNPFYNEADPATTHLPKAIATLAPGDRLGLHTGKPTLVLIDEFGKANPVVQTALLPVILDRRFANYRLAPGSIVMLTSNLSKDNLGDLIPGHALSRLTRIHMRGPTAEEFCAWASREDTILEDNRPVHNAIKAWILQNPQAFEEYYAMAAGAGGNNPWIYDPNSGRTLEGYTCPRSVAKCSPVLWAYRDNKIDEETMRLALHGKIGAPAGDSLHDFVLFDTRLPSPKDVFSDPKKAANVCRDPELRIAMTLMAMNLVAAVDDVPKVKAALDFFQALENEPAMLMFCRDLSGNTQKARQIDCAEWLQAKTAMAHAITQ